MAYARAFFEEKNAKKYPDNQVKLLKEIFRYALFLTLSMMLLWGYFNATVITDVRISFILMLNYFSNKSKINLPNGAQINVVFTCKCVELETYQCLYNITSNRSPLHLTSFYTHRDTHTHTKTYTHRHTHRDIHTHTHTHTETYTHSHRDIYTHRNTDRHIHTHTETHKTNV